MARRQPTPAGRRHRRDGPDQPAASSRSAPATARGRWTRSRRRVHKTADNNLALHYLKGGTAGLHRRHPPLVQHRDAARTTRRAAAPASSSCSGAPSRTGMTPDRRLPDGQGRGSRAAIDTLIADGQHRLRQDQPQDPPLHGLPGAPVNRFPILAIAWAALLVAGFAVVFTLGAPVAYRRPTSSRPPCTRATPVTQEAAEASAATIVRLQYPAFADVPPRGRRRRPTSASSTGWSSTRTRTGPAPRGLRVSIVVNTGRVEVNSYP